MIKQLIAFPLLLIFFMTNANADFYECEVKDSVDVKDDGQLGKYQLGKIGSKFLVDSKTGAISGRISNQLEDAEKPQIFGSRNRSGFVKIFTIVGGPFVRNPLLLEIRQGGSYTNDQILPFTAFFLSEIFSGLCRRIEP